MSLAVLLPDLFSWSCDRPPRPDVFSTCGIRYPCLPRVSRLPGLPRQFVFSLWLASVYCLFCFCNIPQCFLSTIPNVVFVFCCLNFFLSANLHTETVSLPCPKFEFSKPPPSTVRKYKDACLNQTQHSFTLNHYSHYFEGQNKFFATTLDFFARGAGPRPGLTFGPGALDDVGKQQVSTRK